MKEHGFISYAVHDITGTVLRFGTCSTQAFDAQARTPDEYVVESHGDIHTDFILAAQSGKEQPWKVDLNKHQSLRKGKQAFVKNQ